MNTFSPEPSVTYPAWLSMMASSYPALRASTLASPELTYWPVPLAPGGRMLWSLRFHDEILVRTPVAKDSSPRYAPHGHTAMVTLTGAGRGFKPISPYPR